MDDSPSQTTLNIPSLVAFAVILSFAIRYFFFSAPSSHTTSSTGSPSGSSFSSARPRRPFPADRVNTLAGMFPQLARRDIEWDLVRNGGSIQASSERVLRQGRLPPAPPNFQAVYANTGMPADGTGAGGASTGASRGGARPYKRAYEDLITRYNLGSKVKTPTAAGDGEAEAGTGTAATEDAIQSSDMQKAKGGWSANKTERQDLLKRRREEMVLAARRKLEERDRKGKERAQ